MAAATLIGSSGVAQSLVPVWSFESDGSWIAEDVALGDHGGQVFSEYGPYVNSRVLLSAHAASPPAPIWSDIEVGFNYRRIVESASEADVHVAMHQAYPNSSSTSLRTSLRKFSSGFGTPDWIYEFPVDYFGTATADLLISASGERIVGMVFDPTSSTTMLAVFHPDSGSPAAYVGLNTLGPVERAALSDDGRTLALVSGLKMTVVDVDSAGIVFEKYLTGIPNYGALALTGDGARLAYGTLNAVHEFGRTESGHYAGAEVHVLPSSEFCRRLAYSRDGSHLALGLQVLGEAQTARIRVLDALTGSTVFEYEASGSGVQQNLVEEIRLSSDGKTLAVGLWGDGAQTVPELLLVKLEETPTMATMDLAGSVAAMELSPDGQRLAVAAKGTHANDMGGGGGIHLFETRSHDFKLQGTPSIGDTVTFAQEHQANAFAVVISSPNLGSEPRLFPGIGNLLLDENNLSFLPHIAACDADGMAYTPYQIQNDSALIGTTVYFQGLGLRPRQLSEDMVRMTILP